MPLINTSVPNLIQGVSQQPDATRFSGQCEEQENALSSIVDGLKKRPNTRYVSRLLQTAIAENSFVHFINRSLTEKYVVIHDGSKIQIFNLEDGQEAEINGQFGGYTPAALSYLDTSTPRASLKSLTVADNTFILNTDRTVKTLSEKTEDFEKEAIVFVTQGDYEKEYEINFSSGAEVVLSFNLRQWELVGGYWTDRGTITYNTGQLLDRSGAWRYFIPNDVTATIINAGSGYEVNKSFSDNYTLTFNNIEAASNVVGVYATSFDVKVETDSNGAITAATVQALGGNGTVTGTSNSATIYGSYSLVLYGPDYTKIDFEPPAPEGGAFANIGKIVFKTGAADATAGGANADTRQIAFGLGFDARESSNGARTSETTTGIIDPTKLAQPETQGSVIKFKRADGADFKITTTDGLGDTGLGVAYKKVNSITDLPARNFNNFKVKIVGDADLNQDDYYVQFRTEDGGSFGAGSYTEITAFNERYKLDNSTLPFRLISEDVNKFTLSDTPYNERIAGDDLSNPFPSFVGNRISNLFFYKNRLGFLSNENVILSEAGEFFNFFRTTTQSLLDSAPIDVAVASGRVTNFKAANGFQENLILFADNSQFVLKGGDLLTPSTVSITPVTNFSVSSAVDPISLGSYIYFPYTRGSFTGFMEYAVNSTTDNYDSTEITEHVPNYIPLNLSGISGTTTSDVLCVTTSDDPNSLFVYNYFWNGAQKLLSSWSKYTFKGNIIGIEFIQDTLYMVMVLNDETHLVELPFEAGTADDTSFVTHLDMRVSRTVAAGTDSITLPYSVAPSDGLQVWTKDGAFLESTSNLNSVQLSQTVDEDTEVWVGFPYTMKYTFSEQIFKAAAGQGKSPSNVAKLMLKNINLFYSDTAAFEVKVTPKFRDTVTTAFTPNIVGESTLGTLTLSEGAFRVPVFTKAKDTTITIESDSALPCAFQSAEFESFLHSRSNRIT